MMVTPIIDLTLLYTTNQISLRPAFFGTEDNIAVNSDTFVDGLIIANSQLSLTTITVFNKDTTNSLDYKMFSHLDDNGGTPPAFSGEWAELPEANSAIVTVPKEETRAERIIEDWAYLLFRFKRTTAGNNATAKIRVRSRQSRL